MSPLRTQKHHTLNNFLNFGWNAFALMITAVVSVREEGPKSVDSSREIRGQLDGLHGLTLRLDVPTSMLRKARVHLRDVHKPLNSRVQRIKGILIVVEAHMKLL